MKPQKTSNLTDSNPEQIKKYIKDLDWDLKKLYGQFNSFISLNNFEAKMPHGQFSDSTTQTWASTTVAYPITLNTDEGKNQVTHSTTVDTSRIYVDVAGTYLVTFSACTRSPSGAGHVNMWLRKNGIDVPRTNTTIELLELVQVVMTVTYLQTLKADDYIEIMGNSQDVANCALVATGVQTTPDVPASPSIIVTINKISK
jgi:hypothetical protein